MQKALLVSGLVTLALAACGPGATASTSAATPPPGHDHGGPSTSATPDPALASAAVATSAVSIANFAFSPLVITVKAGTKVTWTNDDQDAHTVAFRTGSAFASPGLQKGETFSHVFDTPGSYPYICSIHPAMHGMVVVT